LSASTWPPDPSAAGDVPKPGAGETPAAVLVPLFLAGDAAEPHVVLTRRRGDLRRHAGEIAFPGGRHDPADASLAETALREAEEEIGLPRAEAKILGALDRVSTFATGYVIHPFVAQIPAGLAWRLSPREVDAVIELPLADVSAARTRIQLERRGFRFETDAYTVGDHVIWGATARIVELLLERLHDDGGALRLSS
jgi:8-oxo-dGTP pyrophosphatase MutT (NUDIX family)